MGNHTVKTKEFGNQYILLASQSNARNYKKLWMEIHFDGEVMNVLGAVEVKKNANILDTKKGSMSKMVDLYNSIEGSGHRCYLAK